MINFLNKIISCFLMLLISTSLLQSQETISNSKEPVLPRIEKTYLHTDKTCYTLGESLWYKVYSVYAYTHLLFDNSHVLYVELVSPDSKIIARNKTRLQGGLGHGDFKLKDSIGVKAGIYQIRAYTNFNRNFEDDFVFKKEIEIIDVFDGIKGTAVASKSKIAITPTLTNKESAFKTQFFPEGGSLIHNIQSIIAFKAVDKSGYPIAVQGKIFDSNNELVTFFGSLHDGMGKFQLKPVKGEQYYAEITSNGNQIKVQLPKVEDTGYLLSFKQVRGTDILTIKTNQETLSQQSNIPLTLICKTRGVTYFEGTNLLTETMLSLELPKTNFPEGISQITLYDGDLKPQSERLVFIETENNIEVKLTTNKKTYKPNEKVTVSVSSKTKTGDAVPASFSVSAIDLNGINNIKDYSTTISSYFLMQSDIRGEIHQPGYYFDTSNPRRLVHLDLLLLTQGWRDFLWKKAPKPNSNLKYKIEKGFVISGSVKQLFGNKPKPNNTVNLTLFRGRGIEGFDTVTDSIGNFKFDSMEFTGETSLFLNTKNKKGKRTGKISLNALSNPPIGIDFKKERPTNYTPEINTIKESVYKKYALNSVAPENVLDAIEITAKKESYLSEYGIIDYVYQSDETESEFVDIYQLIQSEIPGIVVNETENDISFPRFDGPVLILLDGVPFDPRFLNTIQPNAVAKINVYKSSTSLFGEEGLNGVITIHLKKAGSYAAAQKEFHSIKEKIEGFYDARMYYSTDPSSSSFENDNTLAVRNTLYWNPYIHPDKTGNSKVSYYNSNVQTQVKLTLEGLTATGIPVVVKTDYTIEK